jgi:hypothetical protein
MKKYPILMIPLVLAACADNQSFIGISAYNPSYLPGEHAMYGPIQTFVRGGPYPGLQQTDETGAVIAAMQDGGFHDTKFTTETVGRSPYRVLMVFNPTPGTGLEQLCEIDAGTIAALPAVAIVQWPDRPRRRVLPRRRDDGRCRRHHARRDGVERGRRQRIDPGLHAPDLSRDQPHRRRRLRQRSAVSRRWS